MDFFHEIDRSINEFYWLIDWIVANVSATSRRDESFNILSSAKHEWKFFSKSLTSEINSIFNVIFSVYYKSFSLVFEHVWKKHVQNPKKMTCNVTIPFNFRTVKITTLLRFSHCGSNSLWVYHFHQWIKLGISRANL